MNMMISYQELVRTFPKYLNPHPRPVSLIASYRLPASARIINGYASWHPVLRIPQRIDPALNITAIDDDQAPRAFALLPPAAGQQNYFFEFNSFHFLIRLYSQ